MLYANLSNPTHYAATFIGHLRTLGLVRASGDRRIPPPPEIMFVPRSLAAGAVSAPVPVIPRTPGPLRVTPLRVNAPVPVTAFGPAIPEISAVGAIKFPVPCTPRVPETESSTLGAANSPEPMTPRTPDPLSSALGPVSSPEPGTPGEATI